MPSQEYNEMDTDNKDSMASKSIATNDIFVIDTFPPSGRDAHMSGRRRSSQVSRDSPFMDRNHNNRASTRSNQSVKSSKMHISLTRVPSLSLQEIKKVSPDSLPKPIVEEIEETKSHSGIFGDHTFTRQEICTISSLALGNLCLGTLYALLAPFFPHEAEKKGVSPTLYGLVFGIFEFGQFIFAPLAGMLIPHLGTKFSLTIGLFITGWCTVVFGSLQWCPPGMTYFWLAFVLRLVSSTGAAAYFTASFTLIASDFSERISSLFALTEVCFGLGMIVGPSIGGVLFEAGGFSLPFFATGAICFCCSLFSFFALKPKTRQTKAEAQAPRVSVFKLTTKLGIMINILISFTTFINVGFNDATLEHHLRDFTSLSKTAVGGMFLVSGVVYAATTQGWGCLIQRFDNAHMFVIAGYILTAASFLLCGPMWPLPFNPSLPLVIVAQFLYGASMGPQLVGSFTQGLSETIAAGFPDDIATSAALSSLYQSSCALGAAVGPSMGGYLMDNWGYSKASSVIFVMQVGMIIVLVAYNVWKRYQEKNVREEGAEIESEGGKTESSCNGILPSH